MINNKPPRYILCASLEAGMAYLQDLDRETFNKYGWIHGYEGNILNHQKNFPNQEYKGFILPCFKDNPEHDLIWSAHVLLLKSEERRKEEYTPEWFDEWVEKLFGDEGEATEDLLE